MPPAQDTSMHSKRPGLARHVSESSYISQSPSESAAPSSSYKACGAHRTQKHVVGKLGRNVSFGKNLHKLSIHTTPEGDGADAQQVKRAKSGVESAPSSPRPGYVKRNSSGAVMKRNTSHTALRKNLSSGHLPRHGSAKNLAKHGRPDAPKMKRTSSDKGKQHRPSPPAPGGHLTVRFDVGDDEEQEDGWTDNSTSQSPEVTRANTRSNSVVGQQAHSSNDSRPEHRRQPSDHVVRFAQPSVSPPPSAHSHSLPESPYEARDYATDAQRINGSSSYIAPPRTLDADMVASRMFQRSPQEEATAQLTMVSASGQTNLHDRRSPSLSQGTLLGSADTQGKDLVSRFINGPGSSGTTPRDSSFLPTRQREGGSETPNSGNENLAGTPKRNKSVPNMAHPLSAAASVSSLRRINSGMQQTPAKIGRAELNPSRTQQKLWLQRASSTIEPQKMIPSVLPKTVGPPLLGPGVNYTADGAGRLDPRLQRQFDQVQLEYRAIRRFRNPLAEAIRKLDHAVGARKEWIASGNPTMHSTSLRITDAQRDGTRTPAHGPHSGRASTVGSGRNSGAATPAHGHDKTDASSRRSRTSSERPRKYGDQAESEDDDEDGDEEDTDEDESGRGSLSSPSEPSRAAHHDDAYDICRRLWDMPAAGEGG